VSTQHNIGRTAGWHRFERQTLRIPATPANDAVLRWVLLAGAVVLMEVEDADIAVPDEQDQDAPPEGFVDIPVGGTDDAATLLAYANVPAGLYRYELWDVENATLLTFGDVLLLPGAEPPEVEE
jgi:hypothetical protein